MKFNILLLWIAKFLTDIYNPLYIDGNPAGIKATLHLLGIVKNFLRPPLVSVSKNTYFDLAKALKVIDFNNQWLKKFFFFVF